MRKKTRSKLMRVLYQIHLWTGLILCLPFVIVGLTGTYMVFPQTIGSAFTSNNSRAPVKVTEAEKPISIEQIINLAKSAVPDTRVQSINFPQKSDQAYRLSLVPKKSREGGQVTVFIDQYQGTVAEIRDPKNASSGEAFLNWGRALHSGKIYGLVWKLIILTVGFTPLLFSITGITLWLMKRRKRKNKKAKNEKTNPRTRIK